MQKSTIFKGLHEERIFIRLFISRLSFLHFDEKCLLESKTVCINDLLKLNLDDVSLMVGRIQKSSIWQPQKIIKFVERDIKLMGLYGVNVLFYDYPEYPYLLKQIYDPPYALFYRGNAQCLDFPCVAIVGTRKPNMNCAQATKNIAKDIAMSGISIVSGLAFGIDAHAHMGCLMAQGHELVGKTIAVLGSGVDNITPSSNKRLAGAILASGGCIISEYHLASPVQHWQFVERNRIISALSRVVLVMQAPEGSGALYTADFAIEHNRELCFYKGSICENIVTQGSKEVDLFDAPIKKKRSSEDYVKDGASVVEGANDVLLLVNSMTFLEERDFSQKKLDKINNLL